jgi:hypothetical protein
MVRPPPAVGSRGHAQQNADDRAERGPHDRKLHRERQPGQDLGDDRRPGAGGGAHVPLRELLQEQPELGEQGLVESELVPDPVDLLLARLQPRDDPGRVTWQQPDQCHHDEGHAEQRHRRGRKAPAHVQH